MAKEMLINTVTGQECRIAIVEDGRLEELYVERVSSASHVGNIYKGRLTNVEPAIQAAFVDFGGVKNAFLHISDVHPQYFPKGRRHSEPVGKKRPHRERPPIQECLRRGQEVVVQMTKEGIGTKGPTMTTYLSIPGRLLVMMPGMSRLGVSRKIEDEEARAKARQILADLSLPPDMGFIIRTAGLDRAKRDLQRDLQYLTRLWKSVSQRIRTARVPSEIYQESDLVIRTLRDVYNTDIERIICDNEVEARKVKEFLDVAVPRGKYSVELYVGQAGLFHDFHVESEIERIYARRVELRSGGSLVIDQTEALVAIDVNSGRFREHSDAETTALKINLEAAGEIARQLRLRDMGGVIIMDFIDMREEKNRRAVERALREAVRNDRAKNKIIKISAFGIVEMTRQRVRPSLKDSIFRRCADCGGSGLIKSEESQALLVMRDLQRACCREDVANIEVVVTPPVAHQLFNYQRREISQLEEQTHRGVIIRADPSLAGDEIRINCTNNRGSPVAWDAKPLVGAGKGKPVTINIDELPGRSRQEQASLTPEEQEAAPEAPTAPEPAEEVEAGIPLPAQAEIPAAQVQAPAGTARPAAPPAPGQPQLPTGKKKRRRGRRGGKKHKKRTGGMPPLPGGQAPPGPHPQQPAPTQFQPPRPAPQSPPQRPPAQPAQSQVQPEPQATYDIPAPARVSVPEKHAEPSVPVAHPEHPAEPAKLRRRTRRGGRKHRKQATADATEEARARAQGLKDYAETEDEDASGAPMFKPGD